jgi:hypothetical protein
LWRRTISTKLFGLQPEAVKEPFKWTGSVVKRLSTPLCDAERV